MMRNAELSRLLIFCWASLGTLATVDFDACVPVDQQPNWGKLEEFENCSLSKTWPELASEEKRCLLKDLNVDNCTFKFKNGGLGDLMVEDEYYDWVCVMGDDCARTRGEDYFCYVYSEIDGTFLPWNTNGKLQLFEEEVCSEGWPSVFGLDNVSVHGGYVIMGPQEENLKFGLSVHPAGDVNDDGIADMLVSSENYDFYTGAVWVIFGNDSITYDAGQQIAISTEDMDPSAGFMIVGEQGSDFFGSSARYAGDVNGDGVDDIIIGAAGNDPQARSNAGAAYVIFGRSDNGFPASLSVEDLDGSNGFSVHGAGAKDHVGTHVSGTGDVNGDGFDDVLIAAWHYDGDSLYDTAQGRVYVLFGGDSFSPVVDLWGFGADQGFTITSHTYALRMDSGALGWAGDVDGDGYGDVLVGAEAASGCGEAFLIYGHAAGYPGGVNVAALGADGLRMMGVSAYSNTGNSVSGVGDVNGDGVADVVVGAYEKQVGGKSTAGEAYVVYGRWRPRFAWEGAGWSVGAAGDVNGDGLGDVVVGAYKANGGQGQGEAGGADHGAAYVVFGQQGNLGAEFSLADVDGRNGFKVHGWQTSGAAGYSVMGGMDLNGDGFDDVMIGAPYEHANLGTAYVVLGKPPECDKSIDEAGDASAWLRCDASKTLGPYATCTLPSLGCCGEGLTCYVKSAYFNQCLPTGSCTGSEYEDWECAEFQGQPGACGEGDGTLEEWKECTHDPAGCKACNLYGQQMACYRRDAFFAQCLRREACPPVDQADWDCVPH